MCDEDKKWFYAYAMGAGCTTEDNSDISVAIRRRVTELQAVIHRRGHRGSGRHDRPNSCSSGHPHELVGRIVGPALAATLDRGAAPCRAR